MKKFILILLSLYSFSSFSSLEREQVLGLLSGQWSAKIDSGEVKFLIRSSGDISVISNAHRNYVRAKVSFNHSESSWGMNGLPVAHIILSEGSDEDVRDTHLLVTGLQEGQDIKIKRLAAFSTFNDGPNEYSDVEIGSRFKKYDPRSGRWLEIR
jgi:hypothetical protein